MSKIFYLKIANEKTGLCNQIYSLASAICNCIKYNKNIVIISNFMKSIDTNNYCPISEIFNLNKLNLFLKKNNITLFDHNYINISDMRVKYGRIDSNIDITDKVKNIHNKIIINKNTNINLLCEDPIINCTKKIFVSFYLNNTFFEFIYDEQNGHTTQDIIFDFNDISFNMMHNWDILQEKSYNTFFKNFVNNIEYSDNINNKVFNTINNLQLYNYNGLINVIHLRLEDDAINHWSKQNNMCCSSFKNTLINKYITEIQQNIDKNYITIILSYSVDNEIINYLRNNQYNYKINSKDTSIGREINAIIDLSIGKLCNNVYIGPGSSTFTQCIINTINNRKTILFDFDHIINNSRII
jgi:hypothetical protein